MTIPEWLADVPVPSEAEFVELNRVLGERQRAGEELEARLLSQWRK